jgi:hypothetical protein
MDKLVAQRFKFLYPKADIVSNVIIDGFRLDLSFPNIKLNVELDGPSHRYGHSSSYTSALLTLYQSYIACIPSAHHLGLSLCVYLRLPSHYLLFPTPLSLTVSIPPVPVDILPELDSTARETGTSPLRATTSSDCSSSDEV